MKIKFLSCVLAAALMLISFASCITENPPVEFSNSDTTDDTTVYEGTTYPPATVPTIHSHAEETTRTDLINWLIELFADQNRDKFFG